MPVLNMTVFNISKQQLPNNCIQIETGIVFNRIADGSYTLFDLRDRKSLTAFNEFLSNLFHVKFIQPNSTDCYHINNAALSVTYHKIIGRNVDRVNKLKEHVLETITVEKNITVLIVQRIGQRSIKNIDQLCDLLTKLKIDYHVHLMENHKFEGQIKLFAGATVVITPHGAALVHLLWMRRGSAIIELFPYKFYFSMYYKLAVEQKLRYYNLPSTEGFSNDTFTTKWYDYCSISRENCLKTADLLLPCCRSYIKAAKITVNLTNLQRKLMSALSNRTQPVCKFTDNSQFSSYECS